MTEKELHKLRRQDLLQLLLLQSREAAQQQAAFEELKDTAAQLRESNERLKGKLDEKDRQIDRLKGRLDHKDEEIHALRSELDALQGPDLRGAARRWSDPYETVRPPVRPPEPPAEPAPAPAPTPAPEPAPTPEPAEEEPASPPASEPEREQPADGAESEETSSLFKEGSIWHRRKLKSRQLNYWKRS